MDAVCEFCGSRMCLKASPKQCRHTGKRRTPVVVKPDPGPCEFCGSRICAKVSPERCRHTGDERKKAKAPPVEPAQPQITDEPPLAQVAEPPPPIPEEIAAAPTANPLPFGRGRKR